MAQSLNKRWPSRNGESVREFLFHESVLDGTSFARDFVPAFLIMIVALGLSVWLPVEADSGLRPVESSLLVIVGSLAACSWIVVRCLRRLKRRVLAISSEAVRVYPPRGLLALPGHPDAADLEIPHESVAEVVSSRLDSIVGNVLRSKAGMTLSRYEIRTDSSVSVPILALHAVDCGDSACRDHHSGHSHSQVETDASLSAGEILQPLTVPVQGRP